MKIEKELTMCEYDPADFVDYVEADDPVCAKCFSDKDISLWIKNFNGPPGCSFCGESDAPTAPLDDVVEHMRGCLLQFYGFAVDQLPYESKEGGYQGTHWDTYDLLFDQLGLDLPRERDDRLRQALSDRIYEEYWCDYDWLSLDYDEELNYAWKKFCRTIQHERRFFFALPRNQESGADDEWLHSREGFPPLGLLHEIVKLAEEYNMVRTLRHGTTFFRARPCAPHGQFQTARELGPPPSDSAVQANRMNPPGIPMMYGAETNDIAVRETRSPYATVGRFLLERETRILDLADLPEVPGIFSGVERRTRLGLIFVHAFAREIARPVDRTDRINIDYIPSQVVTEFIRDAKISGKLVDGIRYPSNLDPDGRNLVLFADQKDLKEPDGTPVSTQGYPPPAPWIRLMDAELVEVSAS